MVTTFFIIAFIFCSAIAVAGILLGNNLISNYSNQFLRSYFYYLMSFFAFAYYGLWAQLLVRFGLNRITLNSNELSTLVDFLPILGLPFLFISWVMLIKMSDQIVRNSNGVRKELLIHGTILVTASLVILLAGGFKVDGIVSVSSNIPVESLLFMLLLESIYFAIYGIQAYTNNGRSNYIRNFNLLLFLGLAMRLVLLIISSLLEVLLPLTITIYFLTNFFPLFYLWRGSDQHLTPVQSSHETGLSEIEKLTKRFNITKREKEIIHQICLGKTNQQIADELFISLQTVKDHTHRIYRKIGVNSRTKLIRLLS